LTHDVLIFDGEGVHPTRVAVVGCDYWGKNLVRNFGELGTAAWIVSSRAFIPMRMLSYLPGHSQAHQHRSGASSI
jgi:hypothetical protein